MRYKRSSIRKIFRISNWFYWLLILVIISTGLYLGYLLYNNYNNTNQWEKSNKELKIANEEPYMLYLTPKDRQNLMTYNTLLTKIYNKEEGTFNDGVDNKLFNEFKDEYNSLPESIRVRENHYYNIVSQLYPIYKEFNTFFNRDGSLSEDFTPIKFKRFVDSNGTFIKQQLDDETDNSKKVLLTHIYGTIHNLNQDIQSMGKLIEIFNATFETSTTAIYIKEDVSSQILQDWDYYRNELIYDWKIVTRQLTKIIEASKPILAKHDEQIKKIEVYKMNQQEKTAFDQFVSQLEEVKKKVVDVPVIKNRKEIENYTSDFKFEIEEEYSDVFEKDDVIRQVPDKELYKKVYKGSTIKLIISKGKEPDNRSSRRSNNSISSSLSDLLFGEDKDKNDY